MAKGRVSRSWWRDGGVVAVIVGLMAAVSLLPPDTSLQEVRKGGILRACVPQENAPLVTGDPVRPGIDVEILQEIAAALDLRLVLNPNAAIGRELDPRAWLISRASCHIIGGGIVTGDVMASFMQLTPPHLETGWTVLAPGPMPDSLAGMPVGVYVGMLGRDRLALSRMLRAQGAEVIPVDTDRALAQGLSSGRFAAGIADTVLAGAIAAQGDYSTAWLSEEDHSSLAFGLWKGDQTLIRAVEQALSQMEESGRLDQIISAYGVEQPQYSLGQTRG